MAQRWLLELNGIKINIINRTKATPIKTIERLIPNIRAACEAFTLSFNVGTMTKTFSVTLVDAALKNKATASGNVGYFMLKEFLRGTYNVYINTDFIGINEVRTTLFHELAHLWHAFIGETMKRSVPFVTKLNIAIARQRAVLRAASSSKSVSASLSNLRMYLADFLWTIYIEGIAKYAEELMVGSRQQSTVFYGSALRIAERIEEKLVSVPKQFKRGNIAEFRKDMRVYLSKLEPFTYYIGTFITAFLVEHGYTIEELMKLSPYSFVKAYEAKASNPVISVTSGRGVFDYGRALKYITEAAKYAASQKIV